MISDVSWGRKRLYLSFFRLAVFRSLCCWSARSEMRLLGESHALRVRDRLDGIREHPFRVQSRDNRTKEEGQYVAASIGIDKDHHHAKHETGVARVC